MNRLKDLRKRKNLTQSQFGDLWGASQNTVSNWENGNREISQDLLVRFASFFGVSVDYLLGLSDESSHAGTLESLGVNQRYIANVAPRLNEDQAKVIRALLDQMGIK